MEYLYLIECREFHKIGVTGDVRSRLAQLSTGNPFELCLVAVFGFRNAEIVERAIHQRFDYRRERGEWFRLTADDVSDFLNICVALGGAPQHIEDKIIDEAELDEAEEYQELLGGLNWRLERRNDRNPPGFAVMERGAGKKCLGYISGLSLKNPSYPTIQEVENFLEEKYGASIVPSGNMPVSRTDE